MSSLKTCVGVDAKFIVGVHKPEFKVLNFRDNDCLTSLGQLKDGTIIDNSINFPKGDLFEPNADIIYEIANAFPFRGTTYINSAWADIKADHSIKIHIPKPEPCSLLKNFQSVQKSKNHNKKNIDLTDKTQILDILPHL